MSHGVIIKDAVKRYGDFTALKGVNLEIKAGEFYTLLGPSGCGKTTLLRMIAGFNSVNGGEILFDDKVINNMEAHKRDIGMVFQNYAIFPHLTVAENVAYGLKAKKVPKGEIKKRVEEALELVQIRQLKDRRPNELSGGQQQRVALARAFVIEPGVLLMDEPLSNLDAKLRVQMRTVIKKLQRRLGITTIYVTHDQEEALAISDRIAVMKAGDIMQVGTPEQIYKSPENTFVAGFIGISNFIKCNISGDDPQQAKAEINKEFTIKLKLRKSYSGKALLSARPEQLSFSDSEGISGKIIISTFLGDFIEYEIELDNGQTIQLNEYTKDTNYVHQDGEKVLINFNKDAISIYTDEAGELISC
ncbi:ABC transporter ATP-binding protein [Clostridium sp. NSJ-6]|uniref:Spermidine/putrescine import ATP-binding protein PotA n=1 Tax=Clostridium hominis TaxID=2763036 RepID=A0ABR7DDM0_9CLOT|nr:ABC transporter ATP-binding protein [Clostridium hominis]MBC5629180.1 ABC transporter ATP-binding protein [Clostridium hominis]MDU2671759.1 ABC transporter ATP-binding protein [Clostridium sp.]